MNNTRSVVTLLPLALTLHACQNLAPPPPDPFDVMVRVESDPGRPISGAIIARAGEDGPSTGADGHATLHIAGQEGESVDLTIKCPLGFTSPTRPISVGLRRISGKTAEYSVLCPPNLRRMVIAIRADNTQGADIPVTFFQKPIGKLDAAGAFTTAFDLKPGDGVELVLDTSDPALKRMKPQSPSGTFTMKPYDDVVTFDQTFKWDALPPPPPPPRPHMPGIICPKPQTAGPDGRCH